MGGIIYAGARVARTNGAVGCSEVYDAGIGSTSAGVLSLGGGKGSHRGRTCTGIRTARLDTSATAAVGVDLAQSLGATLLSR
jgi:hypothetical protein